MESIAQGCASVEKDSQEDPLTKDCAVCLQKCHHPTQLPCGHIFCFLCVKGVAIQNRKCAMCRAAIPSDYLDHPVLLEKVTLTKPTHENDTEEHQWYYEGRNGWWKYDERSNDELEAAWNEGASQCILLLAGALYCINFPNMVQTRRNDPTRRRKVRRDAPSLPSKGIAGIKIIDETKTEESNETSQSCPTSLEEISEENDQVIIIVNSTDETVTPDHNDNEIDDVVDHLISLSIRASTSESEET